MSLTERSYKVPTDACLLVRARIHTRTRTRIERQTEAKGEREEVRERGSTVTKWLVAVRTLRQRESNHVCRLMGRARARDRSTGALRDANRFSGVALRERRRRQRRRRQSLRDRERGREPFSWQ